MSSTGDQLLQFKAQQEDARILQAELDAKVEAVKASLRASQETADGGFGVAELDARMEFDGDDKMRKSSGRLKARQSGVKHGTSR